MRPQSCPSQTSVAAGRAGVALKSLGPRPTDMWTAAPAAAHPGVRLRQPTRRAQRCQPLQVWCRSAVALSAPRPAFQPLANGCRLHGPQADVSASCQPPGVAAQGPFRYARPQEKHFSARRACCLPPGSDFASTATLSPAEVVPAPTDRSDPNGDGASWESANSCLLEARPASYETRQAAPAGPSAAGALYPQQQQQLEPSPAAPQYANAAVSPLLVPHSSQVQHQQTEAVYTGLDAFYASGGQASDADAASSSAAAPHRHQPQHLADVAGAEASAHDAASAASAAASTSEPSHAVQNSNSNATSGNPEAGAGGAGHERLWPLFVLALAYIHCSSTSFALPVLLPTINEDMHLTDFQGAMLTSGYSYLYALALIPVGLLADKVNRPR